MMAKGGSMFSTPRSRSGVKKVITKAATAVGKQIAKAQNGMAVTDDKKKTVVGTGTQTRWTSDSIAKSKSKYPQYSKQIDEAVIKQNTRDKALADQEVARTNAAKKKAATTPIVTQRTGGAMYKRGGAAKKTTMIYKKKK